MARERRKAKKVGMDLTPMIDVVFQLIIFFILTMTVTSPDLRDVQLPTALTAVKENTKEQITMLHMFNDEKGLAKNDPTAGKGEHLKYWHVTLSRDSRRFILSKARGIKKNANDVELMEGLPEALVERAREWKPQPDDLIQETQSDNPNAGKIWNMPILVRGDMRAPVIYFAAIVEACEKARIWRMQVSIAPPPESLSRPPEFRE